MTGPACMFPAVDAIIAARDEAPCVGACVDALRRQEYGGELRIVVVDNGSRDGTADVAAAHGAEVLMEQRRGRATARNVGLRGTGAPLVAFLDAHVVAAPDWLRQLVERFADARLGGCQGDLVHDAVDRRVRTYLQASAVRSAENVAADTVRGERNLYPWLSTAACMYRRSALERVGGFDERLLACEDVELSWRIVARGYRLESAPAATATHCERRSWLRFVTKGFAYGRGAAQVEALFRSHGAHTTFAGVRLRGHVEQVLDAVSYRMGFRVQQLAQRWSVADRLEAPPLAEVDAAFRPWFAWTADCRLRISPRAIFWFQDDPPVSIVLRPDQHARFVLDRSGDRVWRLLGREAGREDVVSHLADTYGVTPAIAAADLDALVGDLLQAGLLEQGGGTARRRADDE